MEQEEINRQLKDRIATLEIHEQIFLSMLVALIRTHPHPEIFQKLFDAHVEALLARFLGSLFQINFLMKLIYGMTYLEKHS